ncbi:YdcF family protein [Kutzneria viridogrisea]|uniref:DUF218 domain-containing protein n=2 Tax=Kutzneria TaxID=43356 RepID=W5WMP3_9PSEU|nr:YdcF family protein [Kutzneria albida]AHH99449.1 hypothetical protein KALB_6089 [Kutzneria albida DSM 43870]MBA8922994.1 uncharacterized SAM-binding protein YcdF (DUF218 family) [Kutzneria viridogrisea]
MASGYNLIEAVWFGIAGLWLLAFLISFLIDRRRLRVGVYLVLCLGFLAMGGMVALVRASPTAGVIVLFLLLALVPLSIMALAGFLIANGVTMLRREGRSLGNLLSLLVGLGIIGFVLLGMFAAGTRNELLMAVVFSLTAVLGYISFVFVCFLLYALFYGRIRYRRDADFVVVLGSGLLGGNRVPPLLAGRLDRARTAYEAMRARGGQPLILTSGGQGPDEDLPEGRAMADYLVAAGVPEEHLLVEDRSATTEQNLTFSRAIMAEHKPDYRCVVVTSNYHVLRAALLTRRTKVNGQVIGSRTAMYFLPSAVIREFVGVLAEHKVKNLIICLVLAAPGLLALLLH